MPSHLQDGFIRVRNTKTDRIETVPEHFLDQPALSKNLTKLPSRRAAEEAEGPSTKWLVADLETYAAAHGIDVDALGTRPTKAQLLEAIEAHQPPADEQSDGSSTTTTETPAAGEN